MFRHRDSVYISINILIIILIILVSDFELCRREIEIVCFIFYERLHDRDPAVNREFDADLVSKGQRRLV